MGACAHYNAPGPDRTGLWFSCDAWIAVHADAGYDIAIDCAREQGLDLPMVSK